MHMQPLQKEGKRAGQTLQSDQPCQEPLSENAPWSNYIADTDLESKIRAKK